MTTDAFQLDQYENRRIKSLELADGRVFNVGENAVSQILVVDVAGPVNWTKWFEVHKYIELGGPQKLHMRINPQLVDIVIF